MVSPGGGLQQLCWPLASSVIEAGGGRWSVVSPGAAEVLSGADHHGELWPSHCVADTDGPTLLPCP